MTGHRLQLQQIRNPDCDACPLHESTVNRCVMGRGNVRARVHLIGEAPGEAEARTGMPFMGKAGMFLNEILTSLAMEEMVYISNVARCRPSKNRKPERREAETCMKLYLYPEMEIIQPRVLVLMGRSPIDYIWRRPFVRGQAMMPICKTPRDRALLMGRIVICTWHPSYCCNYDRTGKSSIELKQHLRKARDLAYPGG